MFNQADLPATGLIQPASRVSYRLAVAAPPRARGRACASSSPGPRRRSGSAACAACASRSLEAGRPEMRQTLDRAEKFLNLVALLAALLAAVAVGIAAREFAQRHLDDCAMLRVLGPVAAHASPGSYALEFAAVGLLASVAGVLLGFAVHYVFVWLLAGLVDGRAAGAERVAGAVRRGRGHDAAAGLRPAAGAAAGARAAAARHPA